MRSKAYIALSKLSFFFNRKYSNRLRVLAYHKVPDEKAFEKQVEYLKSHYIIIGIERLLAHFEKKEALPKNALLITFDDGDITVLQKGLPVLEKHNLKSCLFIITGLINTSEDIWIKRVEAKEMEEGKSYAEARQVVKKLKSITNAEREKRMRDYPPIFKQQLSTKELSKMQQQGMYIANHTHTHPMLDNCTKEEITEELKASKKVFQGLALPGFDIFAYPNGNADKRTNSVLKEFQMKLVFLFDHKINNQKLDPLNISRIRVDSDNEMNEFISKVSGVHPFIFNLRKN